MLCGLPMKGNFFCFFKKVFLYYCSRNYALKFFCNKKIDKYCAFFFLGIKWTRYSDCSTVRKTASLPCPVKKFEVYKLEENDKWKVETTYKNNPHTCGGLLKSEQKLSNVSRTELETTLRANPDVKPISLVFFLTQFEIILYLFF